MGLKRGLINTNTNLDIEARMDCTPMYPLKEKIVAIFVLTQPQEALKYFAAFGLTVGHYTQKKI